MALNLRGTQGDFAFTGGNVTVTTTTADVDQWRCRFYRTKRSFVPFQFNGEKLVLGILRGTGRFHIVPISGQTAAPPGVEDGTTGTMTLTYGSKTYSGKATIHDLEIGADSSSAEPIDGWYEFTFACDTSSDAGIANT